MKSLAISATEAEEVRRKDFVRRYVLRFEAQRKIATPYARSKDAAIKNKIHATLIEATNEFYSTDRGRLALVYEAI